ncbi:hypothetical protein BT69DRAFT_295066 [Atractiella rhizophila]|nr:hypothetical protein BT69DRAFT_295066 [Atractiella rhizophila]
MFFLYLRLVLLDWLLRSLPTLLIMITILQLFYHLIDIVLFSFRFILVQFAPCVQVTGRSFGLNSPLQYMILISFDSRFK